MTGQSERAGFSYGDWRPDFKWKSDDISAVRVAGVSCFKMLLTGKVVLAKLFDAWDFFYFPKTSKIKVEILQHGAMMNLQRMVYRY